MFWHMLQYLLYLIVAALIGLTVGWLIWSRSTQRDADALEERAKSVRSENMRLRRERNQALERVARLEGELGRKPEIEIIES